MKTKLLIAVFFTAMAHSAMAQWTTVCGTGDGMVVSFANYRDTLYATGFFTNICGTTHSPYIAKWDGTTWYPVDTGLSDAGHRVEVLDNELYVAQYRQTIDSNWVLKWDGAHFNKIGTGVYLTYAVTGSSHTANIYDVAKFNGNVIACGEFDAVDTRSISGIMQWTGTQWDTISSGLGGSIDGSGIMYPHQMLVYGNSLYVVGNFSTAGGITVNGIARWDGTAWHAMGAGFNKEVYAIGLINGELYVGGEFTMSGTTALQRIARWDGSAWADPGFGVKYSNPSLHAYVHTIQQVGTRGVFEGGFDKAVAGTATYNAHSVIAWAGGQLDTLSGGILNGEFEGLSAYNDTTILVGGAIFAAGSPEVTHVAKYVFTPLVAANVSHISTVVSPNPFSGMLSISGITKGTAIKVLDIMGRERYTHTATGAAQTIDLANLAQGMYVLQFVDEAGAVSYKQIVKQ